MTPKKPEWFEIAEGDDASAGIQKVNKKLPIAALAAVGVIIAAGAVFANVSEEPSATADSTVATSAQSSGTTPSESVQSSNTSQSTSIAPQGSGKSVPSITTGTKSNGVPTIDVPQGAAPQRGEHEEREGHERGERGEHGDRPPFGGDHESREHDDD